MFDFLLYIPFIVYIPEKKITRRYLFNRWRHVKKYLNTPFLAHSTQFNGDMLNCSVKGSLILVYLAFIWRSNDHYGKVRNYPSQATSSLDNFYNFFILISFFFGFFMTLFSLFYLEKQIHPIM